MGLFGFGKKKSEKTKASDKRLPVLLKKHGVAKEASEVKPSTTEEKPAFLVQSSSVVLSGTRVTEKASLLSEKRNVYTFNISADANKHEVSDAVEKLYKVHPLKVRIVSIPPKRVFVRGKRGVQSGIRKAYVFLKEGEKIEVA